MAKHVTLRDIAKATGYHHTTVSMALRKVPKIPRETSEIIQKAAAKLGYRPDPTLKALAFYRYSSRPVSDHGVLAWLSNVNKPTLKDPRFKYATYFKGALARATELGFQIEEFLLRTPGMTAARMTGILRTRGIRGILIPPQPADMVGARIEMDWSHFSAVTFGYSLESPQLDLVTDHHFDSARIASREMRKLGYRRIGFYIGEELDFRTNGALVGGFLRETLQWPQSAKVAPVIYKQWDEEHIRRWVEKERLDAIILPNSREINMAIAALGLRVPEDIGMASLNPSPVQGFACIEQRGYEIGVKAVDLLVGMMNTNQWGVPAIPCRLLINATWLPGKTVRRVA